MSLDDRVAWCILTHGVELHTLQVLPRAFMDESRRLHVIPASEVVMTSSLLSSVEMGGCSCAALTDEPHIDGHSESS